MVDKYDIKRIIEMEAIKAEIEAMKIANKLQNLLKKSPIYDENFFFKKAEELRILASKHNQQL